jgi:hypothetical protein
MRNEQGELVKADSTVGGWATEDKTAEITYSYSYLITPSDFEGLINEDDNLHLPGFFANMSDIPTDTAITMS